MNDEKKFSRGRNYTAEDKNLLLSLVESQKEIIECRITNKFSCDAKKEAWKYIVAMYNAGTTVSRTTIQLKTLYENIKRRTKKDVAIGNKDRYKEILSLEGLEEEEVNELNAISKQEKQEIHKTGGGKFNSSLTEDDHRIIALLADNIRPLENPYDDAHIYFADPDHCPIQVDCPTIPSNDDEDNFPSTSQPAKPSSLIPSESKKHPRRRIKKQIEKKMTPKDRYYLQKLKNAKMEEKILKIRLRRENLELKNMLHNVNISNKV